MINCNNMKHRSLEQLNSLQQDDVHGESQNEPNELECGTSVCPPSVAVKRRLEMILETVDLRGQNELLTLVGAAQHFRSPLCMIIGLDESGVNSVYSLST